MRSARRTSITALAAVAGVLAALSPAVTTSVPFAAADTPSSTDDAPTLLHQKSGDGGNEDAEGIAKLRDAYYWSELLSGNDQLTFAQAARLRDKAMHQARGIAKVRAAGVQRGGTWINQGPSPIVQVARTTNSFEAVAGRIGALVIRNNGEIILGAAQGGIWTYNSKDGVRGTWTPRTDGADSLSVGALALAPTNDKIVYMGSGEGSLAGDSYYGDGIYRSNNGGATWTHVSDKFAGQAVTDLAVDPNNPNHVFASTVRGRGGAHRTSAPTAVPYGVWMSNDGGKTWTLLKGTRNEIHGATDLVMDPQHPRALWASFWGVGIFRTTNAGHTWTKVMGDLPKGHYAEGGTRFSLGLSHPTKAGAPTVYTGFDYYGPAGKYHPAQIWKTTDNGQHWALATGSTTGSDSPVDYCSTQCYYDNEIKPDPNNPDIIYALGCYGYNNSPPSGGVYRSTDGGATWKNLGYDLHPDFHAIAFQPNHTNHIAIGNDGGVWQSFTRGGRNAHDAPLSNSHWQDLNGQVNPGTGALIHSTGLSISQFVSMQTVSNVPGQYWGGTQDNGTLRKSTVNDRWFDQSSGDGGYAVVDQTTPNPFSAAYPAFVFGEYYGISLYRFDPAHVNTIFGNATITNGINLSDRSEFYAPFAQNAGNTNQLFYGTYRMYRTNNGEAASAGDVQWSPISGDLTSGCKEAAPNGARGCLVSAIGVSGGGTGVYAGTDEGWIQVSPNAVTAANPKWHRSGVKALPARPVNEFAVDRSNWRIAYAAFGGFGKATPGNSGHVFATTNGGKSWKNVSGNLPDVPVNSVVLDPSNAKTLYAGTDVGPFVTTDGGAHWNRLGAGIPDVAVWQLSYDPAHGILAAGTHGRGAWTLHNRKQLPALTESTQAVAGPVGPDSTIRYVLTVNNIGNGDATGVRVVDPVPAHTTSGDINGGGHFGGGNAVWDDLTVPAGGSVQLSFTVDVRHTLPASVNSIVNDGVTVTSQQHVSTTGSPVVVPIAPQYAVSVSPASDTEAAKDGDSATFTETLTNEGYSDESYSLATSGGTWNSSIYAADCTTPLTTTDTVASGDSVDVCVKTDVPGDAAELAQDTAQLTATPVDDSAAGKTASLTAVAVADATLLVDEDGSDASNPDSPPDTSSYYADALTAAGQSFGTWDLVQHGGTIPQSLLTAHTNVVWYTGNTYPGPITPYERALKAFLDGGGRLFMSGQDILDQAAGTTSFVHDYLHIDWDGSETQNDQSTGAVHGVSGDPVTDGIGSVPLDHSVLGANYEDEVTPIGPANSAFTDDKSATDALDVSTDGYKVVFLAFPFEAYGSAAQKGDLMTRAFSYFGS